MFAYGYFHFIHTVNYFQLLEVFGEDIHIFSPFVLIYTAKRNFGYFSMISNHETFTNFKFSKKRNLKILR